MVNLKRFSILQIILTFYFRNIAGSPRDLRFYDDQCSWNGKCDTSKFLICMDGRCQCENPSSMIFDTDQNSCVTKVKETCFLQEVWSRGSGTHNNNGPIGEIILTSVNLKRKSSCVAGAVCDDTTEKCACKSGEKENGECELEIPSSPLMQSCDFKDKKCLEGSGLKCVDGKCQCGMAYYQYFKGSQCITRAGGTCRESSECTQFSECVQDNNIGGHHHRCKCSSGFVENNEGFCDGDYDQDCALETMKCSERRRLKCVDGKCMCADQLQIYDKIWSTCRGLVGAKCRLYGDQRHFCVDGAICSESRQQDGSVGECACSSSYYETSNYTCSKAIRGNRDFRNEMYR